MMKKRRRRWLVAAAVLAGCALLALLVFSLHESGLLARFAGEPRALTDYGDYSPAEIGGQVYFPALSEDELRYVPARRAQLASGEPALLTASGESPLPEDYIRRLYSAFGKVAYTPGRFRANDTYYLLITRSGADAAVCGVIIRHNEQFYLGNFDCELSETLLTDLVSALAQLGIG